MQFRTTAGIFVTFWCAGYGRAMFETLTDSNIKEAVDLYFSDPTAANVRFGPISLWDVSRVTDMSNLFRSQSGFNADLSEWNVDKVTKMLHMFEGCTSFTSDLSKWKTSRVTDMQYLFVYASQFDSDLSKWDVSKVTAFNGMFWGASTYNNLGVSLNKWKTSSGKYFNCMFFQASSFNQSISFDITECLDPIPFPGPCFFDGAGPNAQYIPTSKKSATKGPMPAKPTKEPKLAKPTKEPATSKAPKDMLRAR